VLSDGDIVILDAAGGNYIKGWRYQLYCEAKAVRTPSCVVHVGTSIDEARRVNEDRLSRQEEDLKAEANATRGEKEGKIVVQEEEPYQRETWENLVFRYEEPNGMTRWDSPLFTVLWEDEAPQFEAIWDAMVGSPDKKVVVRPNQATVMKPASSEGFLYELDRATQEVVNRIMEWSKDHVGEGGGEVEVEIDGKGKAIVELPANPIGLPALQRMRRQFISLNRQNAVAVARIKESFVGYLNHGFQAA